MDHFADTPAFAWLVLAVGVLLAVSGALAYAGVFRGWAFFPRPGSRIITAAGWFGIGLGAVGVQRVFGGSTGLTAIVVVASVVVAVVSTVPRLMPVWWRRSFDPGMPDGGTRTEWVLGDDDLSLLRESSFRGVPRDLRDSPSDRRLQELGLLLRTHAVSGSGRELLRMLTGGRTVVWGTATSDRTSSSMTMIELGHRSVLVLGPSAADLATGTTPRAPQTVVVLGTVAAREAVVAWAGLRSDLRTVREVDVELTAADRTSTVFRYTRRAPGIVRETRSAAAGATVPVAVPREDVLAEVERLLRTSPGPAR